MTNNRLMVTVATLGGVGYLPGAPGTWGSLAVLPLWWVFRPRGLAVCGLMWLALTAAGLLCAGRAAAVLGRRDHPAVVIDEAAGQLLALAAFPPGWQTALVGFALFRLLDILKPWPLRHLEQLPGSLGVMLDDLAAGALAALGVALGLLLSPG